MEEGIILAIISILLVLIAGLVLATFSFSIFTSVSTINFGFRCFGAFAEYNLIDSFISPLTYITSHFGFGSLYVSPTQAAQVQNSCIQDANVAFKSTSALGTSVFSEASSCFSLFQGATSSVSNGILGSSRLNRVFECYYGQLNNQVSGGNIDYSSLIRYMDSTYNTSYPLQVVFITNGSGGFAKYASPSSSVINSTYLLAYFGYPSGNPPQDCSIPFQEQCTLTSSYQQPVINPAKCSYSNQTVSEAYSLVSSLSNGNQYQSVSNLSGGCTYYVPQCGYLTNSMVYQQSRIFVCIPTK